MSCWLVTMESDGTPRSTWDAAAGMKVLEPLESPLPTWEHSEVSSPVVDGVFGVHSSIGGMALTVRVQVKGASWGQVEGRVRDLIADVSATHRLQVATVVDGVATTWRARRPNASAPITNAGFLANTRTVELTFPVLPHPTITGTV